MTDRGAVLAEVIVALLLLLIGLTSLMAAVVRVPLHRQIGLDESRANLCATAVLQTLRNYVKPEEFAADFPSAPVDETTAVPRPWHLPGDDCLDCWALAEGEHDGTLAMPAECRRPPLNARLKYTVTVAEINGSPTRAVSARIDWGRPAP